MRILPTCASSDCVEYKEVDVWGKRPVADQHCLCWRDIPVNRSPRARIIRTVNMRNVFYLWRGGQCAWKPACQLQDVHAGWNSIGTDPPNRPMQRLTTPLCAVIRWRKGSFWQTIILRGNVIFSWLNRLHFYIQKIYSFNEDNNTKIY